MNDTSGNYSWIIIDIDGPKKGPNKMGKDVFHFIAMFADTGNQGDPGTFVPVGINYNPKYTKEEIINQPGSGCSTKITGTGSGGWCAALIMMDGWEIKDDYPW
jgi:hypothetical protein